MKTKEFTRVVVEATDIRTLLSLAYSAGFHEDANKLACKDADPINTKFFCFDLDQVRITPVPDNIPVVLDLPIYQQEDFSKFLESEIIEGVKLPTNEYATIGTSGIMVVLEEEEDKDRVPNASLVGKPFIPIIIQGDYFE